MIDEAIPSGTGREGQKISFDQLPPVWVINLERSEARWTSIQQSLKSVGIGNYSRIDAVDALRLSKEEIERAYDAGKNRKHYFSPLKTGEIACFLSHRKAWRKLVEGDLNGAFVVEDDVIFRPEAVARMAEVAEFATSAQPMIVKLYSKRGVTGRPTQLSAQTRLVEPLLAPIGAQGAYINRAAAEKLLKHSERFFEPVDVFLQRTWVHEAKIQVLIPNALEETSAQLGGSTLASGKLDMTSRIRREIMRPIFRASLHIRALWERASRK
jgi:GR25 family glycosyltransferase involved in LPS biosynthesis